MDIDDDYLPYSDWKSTPLQAPTQDDGFTEYDLLREGRETLTKQHWILSSIGLVLLVCFIYLLFSLIGLTTQPVLPNALPISTPLNHFSEDRARFYLRNLTTSETTKSRVCLTEGNRMALKVVKEWILDIKEEAQKNADIVFTVQEQSGSGIGPIDWNIDPVPHFYSVENIHVILSKKGVDINKSPAILYFSNIDSNQYPSTGAHDSAMVLSVGLEMLRNLAHSKIERTVIFSFLNCEEPGPLGAASVQSMEWYNQIQFMVNYFNPGLANGLPILHHYTGDDWVPYVYKKAAGDYGFYKANSLFMDFPDTKQEERSSSPLVRGGKVSSLFVSNQGNVQFDNTIVDQYETVPLGIMQWSGELFVSIIKILSFSDDLDDELKDLTKQPKLFFYDIAGHTMVIMSKSLVTGLSLGLAFISIACHILYMVFLSNHPMGIFGNVKRTITSFIVTLLSYLFMLSIILGGTLLMLPNPLFYFRSPYLANTYWILLGVSALLFIQFIGSIKRISKYITSDDDEFSLLISVNLFWTLMMFFNWWIPSYKTIWSVCFFFALMSNLGLAVIIGLKKYSKRRLNWSYTPRNWLLSLHLVWFFISVSLPFIILVSCLKDLQNLLLPDVGLNNSMKVGVIMGIFVTSILLNAIPLARLVRYKGILLILAGTMLAIFFIAIAVQPTYDKYYPKRVVFDEIEKQYGPNNSSYYLQISSDDKLPMKPFLRGIFPETAECDHVRCILKKEANVRENPSISLSVSASKGITNVSCVIDISDSLFQDYYLFYDNMEYNLTHIVVDEEKIEWGSVNDPESEEYTTSSLPVRYKRGLFESTRIDFLLDGVSKTPDFMLFSVYKYSGPTPQFNDFIDSIEDHPMVAVMSTSHYTIEKKTYLNEID